MKCNKVENANKSDQISFADMAGLNGFLTVAVGVSSGDVRRLFRFKIEMGSDTEPTLKLLRDRITVNSEVVARAADSGRSSQQDGVFTGVNHLPGIIPKQVLITAQKLSIYTLTAARCVAYVSVL